MFTSKSSLAFLIIPEEQNQTPSLEKRAELQLLSSEACVSKVFAESGEEDAIRSSLLLRTS